MDTRLGNGSAIPAFRPSPKTLDQQNDALAKAGVSKTFSDSMSGARDDRPGLAELMAYVREGDTVVVWKLDRLGRNTLHILETVKELTNRGVNPGIGHRRYRFLNSRRQNRDVGGGMHLQQRSRQPAVAGAEFEDLGIGHVGDLIDRDARELLVCTENPSKAVQRADHSAFQMVVVAAEVVFQTIGLQPPIQPRGVRAAARHAVDVEDLGGYLVHHGRLHASHGRGAVGRVRRRHRLTLIPAAPSGLSGSGIGCCGRYRIRSSTH
jgi:Resolvase, N terminal domain